MKKIILLLIFACVFFGMVSASTVFLETGAIALVFFVFYELISQERDLFPIGLIALAFAGGQWLVSPIFTYHNDYNLFTMSVDEATYLTYTLWGYSLFFIGVMFCRRKLHTDITVQQAKQYCKRLKHQYTALILIGGLVMPLPINMTALLFFKELFGCLFFVGIIMRMYAIPEKAISTMICGLVYLLVISILNGMFHNLVVWTLFLILTLFYIKSYSLKRRLIIVFTLMVCVSTLQSIKAVYRSYTWGSAYQGSKVALFVHLYYSSLFGEIDQSENEDINSRFNQGWIISRVYSQIPSKTDYKYGQTIIDAIEASVMPRMLFPDKKNSGASSIKDFEEFTGYHLTAQTSMGLSVWGEAYGNFGLFGGGIFMLLWGYVITGILQWLNAITRRYGYWIFFTPLIAFNLIKAEINILSVINWTLKSIVFSFVVIALLRRHTHNKNVIHFLQA